jgi:hypothetical protein
MGLLRWSRAVGIAAVVALSMTIHAAPARTSLGVEGRANANVSLASSGAFVVAVWSSSAPGGDTDVYAASSHDAGAMFSAPVRVNDVPGDARVNGEQPPRVALKPRGTLAPEIAVVWTTKGTAGTKLLSAASTDGGRTFSKSALVPGTDAAGNRGWEAVGLGPGSRFFSVWLDHRRLAPPSDAKTASEHHHDGGGASGSINAATAKDGVAMAQLSQLYVASLDGHVAPQGVTGGVCYCCKTAIATGPGNALFLAWRHVYPGNMRDIAFTMSRDGGRRFAAPVRVSEDRWQLDGCPDDGPSMAVDKAGVVHIVWPSVVTEAGKPVKALFHAMTKDGRSFTPRERIPTQGQANHPQIAVSDNGELAVAWDESGSGSRQLASAIGRTEASGTVRFSRQATTREVGTYPVLVSTTGGRWLQAWTSGAPATSRILIAPLN